MYIKYREIESNEIAVLDARSVKVMKDYNEGGFLLVPNWDEREFRMADAVVSRLAVLCCGLPAVRDRTRGVRREDEQEYFPVFSQMCVPDIYHDCIAWYETLEEANAAIEKIAADIARGEHLCDLTEGGNERAQGCQCGGRCRDGSYQPPEDSNHEYH